jgi:F0F1-type ATP synthase membrane subunit c/vacuolar-type H+-ATPase subunit K
MGDEQEGSFREYRKLIIAHMESSNRRQRALEEALTEIRVQMGVLVVKVGLLVAVLMLVGGTVATYVVSAAVKATAEQIVEEPDEGD